MKLKKKLVGMIKSDERNSQMSNLIDKCNEQALINSPLNTSTTFPDSTFKTHILTSITNFLAKIEDKNIKQLTEMM